MNEVAMDCSLLISWYLTQVSNKIKQITFHVWFHLTGDWTQAHCLPEKLYLDPHNTKHEKHTSTSVYKLKCNDCPKYYIGQTGRSFKTRYTEHIKALTQPLKKSNFAEHIFNTHHIYTSQTKPHTTPNIKNTHPQAYTNLNVMTVPNTILVKQVDPSKHDILNI